MATLYKIGQPPKTVQPVDPKKGFQLGELYEMLECELVEVASLEDGRIIICDEEGLLHGSAYLNWPVTAMYRKVYGPEVGIVGHALVCLSKEFK